MEHLGNTGSQCGSRLPSAQGSVPIEHFPSPTVAAGVSAGILPHVSRNNWKLDVSRLQLFDFCRWAFVSLGLLPWISVLLECSAPTRPIGSALRALYGLQCHQRVARSFTLGHVTMPVCARCLGIYLGMGLAVLVGRPRLRRDAYKAWILVGLLVLGLDVASEAVGLRPAYAAVRTATGALLAYGVALTVLQALRPRRMGRVGNCSISSMIRLTIGRRTGASTSTTYHTTSRSTPK
jgi:uncharacterized membrane protein